MPSSSRDSSTRERSAPERFPSMMFPPQAAPAATTTTTTTTSSSAPPTKRPAWLSFSTAGFAGVSGWMFVHPFDVTKVRFQLVGETLRAGERAPSMLAVSRGILSQEGVAGLYSGLSAAVARQLSYTTLRIGFYDMFKEKIAGPSASKESMSLWQRALCGVGAGAVASFLSCPIEVSLVRMQADGRLPVAERRGYNHVFNALQRIAAEEGIATFWRGATPTVTRAAVVSCTQLATYDQAKDVYRAHLGMSEGVGLHLASALTSGFVYCLASLPLDTAKTRAQNQKPLPDGTLQYRGVVQTVGSIARSEGILSLWRGFGPYFARGGGHTVMMFIFLEQYRRLGDDLFCGGGVSS